MMLFSDGEAWGERKMEKRAEGERGGEMGVKRQVASLRHFGE